MICGLDLESLVWRMKQMKFVDDHTSDGAPSERRERGDRCEADAISEPHGCLVAESNDEPIGPILSCVRSGTICRRAFS